MDGWVTYDPVRGVYSVKVEVMGVEVDEKTFETKTELREFIERVSIVRWHFHDHDENSAY